MRLLKLSALVFLFCCPVTALAQSDPWAAPGVLEKECKTLNAEKVADNKAYISRAIFIPGHTGPRSTSTVVRVLTATESVSAPKALLVRVEMAKTRQPVDTTVEDWANVAPAGSAVRCTTFSLKVRDETQLTGAPLRYEVVFLDFEKSAGQHESPDTAAVGLAPRDAVIVQATTAGGCTGFLVQIKDVPAGFDWDGFMSWVGRLNARAETNDVVILSYEPPGSPTDVLIPVRKLVFLTRPEAVRDFNSAQLCLTLASSVPVGKFPIKLSFKDELFQDTFFAPPMVASRRHLFDISRLREGLKVTGDVPQRAVIGKDRDPSFNSNIEIGGSYTTSVEQQDDGTRKRKKEWVADLRFEPFPIIDSELRPTQWNTNWRPLRVDALVSSGKIARKTLSKNTIAFTSEVETWKFGSANTDNIYRFQYGFREASDRDFKKMEYVGYFRF
jgi:hypothetical protein